MPFACQKDSYLQTLETKIVSCTESNEGKAGYVLILEDTVLFPEGGGQPDDHGTINGANVRAVKRKGNQALHYVDEALPPGDAAFVKVDWQRRFDHMQQHTGQHLITAVTESLLGFATTSWNLGEQISYVELDVSCIKNSDVAMLEKVLNENIRSCIPVTVHFYEQDAPEISEVRTRLKLPEDHNGPIRVIDIQGIDRNTCCGTHLKNTSELQMIKLLYCEKGKKKNKTNLFFVVGNRVLNYLDSCVSIQRSVSSLLSCNSNQISEMVEKLQKSLKLSNKNTLLAMRDLATMEAKVFNMLETKPSFFSLHKKNAEAEFMSIFLNEVNNNSILFFLTVGDEKTGGQLTLSGPTDLVEKYGPLICVILEGKGSAKNGKYQGKFKKFSNIQKAETLLQSANC